MQVCRALTLIAGMAVPSAGPTAAQDAAPAAARPAENGDRVTVNEAGLFNLHLRDVPLAEALRMLSLRSQRNITITESVKASVSTDLYGVNFEEALDALLSPSGFIWYAQGKFVVVCRPEERSAARAASQAAETRIFELHFVAAADVLPIVQKLLSPLGTVATTADPKVPGVALTAESFDAAMRSGLGGKARAVGEFLVVRDRREVLDEIAAVLARMDARPKQVLIEAVILRARLDETNALGVDFNALAGIDFRQIGASSTGGTNLTPGPVPANRLDGSITAIETDLSANVPAGGFSFGLITNNVATFVRALEETVDLTIVANPKVLTVNEQLGRVIVGREDGYLTTTTTETSTIQTVEFIQTGTQILFRPFIGNDGCVRMDIHPEDSSGGLTPDNLPFKDTTEVTTSVVVRDGHTLVIGGLFREVTRAERQQVPWFGHIPILGLLASGKRDAAVREEVIVLITPHIIAGDELSAVSAWAADEVERKRVLAHRALMPWGRERLAQAHYAWALEHQRAGKLSAAAWDLELALWLNPQFSEADGLREELTGRAAREPDYSIVTRLIDELARRELEGGRGTAGSTP